MDPAYLFNIGQNIEAYRFLGAHPTVQNDKEGWVFRVWAPAAKSVAVCGSFNNWDTNQYPMQRLGETGIWECFIEGLSVWDRYKYAIRTSSDQILMKADPFSFHQECRPGTASILYKFQDFEWEDADFINRQKNFDEPQPVNIYEVHLGSWRRYPDGNTYNYREIARQLADYCVELGYTAVELMPIMEYPLDESWGYQVSNYFAPSARYGTPEDFKYLVNTLHKAGLRVFLDWVPAHFPKDGFALYRFDGSPCFEYQDPRLGEQEEWGTMVFDFGKSEVRSFLISSAHYWVNEYHIDGLRIDAVSSMLYLDYGRKDAVKNKYGGNDNLEAIDFLRQLNQSLLEKHPKLFVMAEESTAFPDITRPVSDGGLGFTHKWCMGWMHDTLDYFSQDYYARKYHHNKMTFAMSYIFSERYLLPFSHDEVVHGKKSLIGRMPGDIWRQCASLRCLFAWQIGHPGGKLNFMGSEFGQFVEWRFAEELEWFMLELPQHQKLWDYSKQLNHLYLDHEALWAKDSSWDGFQWVQVDDRQNSVFAFLRRGEKEKLLFVFNLTPAVLESYRLTLPAYGHCRLIMNSDDPAWGGSSWLALQHRSMERLTTDPASEEVAKQKLRQRKNAEISQQRDLKKELEVFEASREKLLQAFQSLLGCEKEDPRLLPFTIECPDIPRLSDTLPGAELKLDLPPLSALIFLLEP